MSLKKIIKKTNTTIYSCLKYNKIIEAKKKILVGQVASIKIKESMLHLKRSKLIISNNIIPW